MPSEFIIFVGLVQVQLVRGDITRLQVDAIVNAANSELAGGGGVDGAIHSAGGPQIMQELEVVRARVGLCPAGHAVMTGAGRLPAKYVFHAVGPRYRDGRHGEPAALASCYSTCLTLAANHQVKSISFPSISTGVYGYPVASAAKIALQTTVEWLREHAGSLETVKLVQFSDQDHQVYRQAAAGLRNVQLPEPQQADPG